MGYLWKGRKDPQDVCVKGFTVNNGWIGDDPIVLATFTPPEDSGLTVDSVTINGNKVEGWFSGGNEGLWDIVTKVTTSSGRVKKRTIKLRVEEL